VNDLVMWDNRCTLHVALADFDQGRTRHMTRTSLVGEPSGRIVAEGAAPDREALMQSIASVS
jgi:taurine dioxygenase